MNSVNLYYYYSDGDYRGYSMRYIFDEDPAWLYEKYKSGEMNSDEARTYRSFHWKTT